MFSWNEKYTLNIGAIDSQHQMLITTLQSVYEACSTGNGATESYNALKFLNWYVIKHFKDEEILQAQCHYPYLEQHKKRHDFYRNKAQKMLSDFDTYGESSSVISEILVSFGTQIIGHITYEDVQFGSYIHSNEIPISNIKNDHYERDELTGLLTKNSFHQIVCEQVNLILGTNNQLAYVTLDVDNFGIVNQSYGYEIGSELLIYISGILHDFSSDSIYIAHSHSDVFTMCIVIDENELDPIYIVNEIRKRIEHGLKREGSLIPLSTSAGISFFPRHCNTPSLLVQKATIALDYAKVHGKNSMFVFEDWMYTAALKNGKIMRFLQPYQVHLYTHVVFQPIYCAKTGNLVACEALLRMNDDEGNPISPTDFIPLAERNHTILDLGYLTLERVCASLNSFIVGNSNFQYVSINLSAIQLNDINLIPRIQEALCKYNIDPNYLAFEITESIFIGDISSIHATLTDLKQLGFKLLLDDFGSGYSSLTYLNRFDFNTLKIDKDFLINILEDEKPKHVMKAIIDLAHILDMNVIVEGVELHEELALLNSLNCDKIQGFLFSKPLPLDDFLKVIYA